MYRYQHKAGKKNSCIRFCMCSPINKQNVASPLLTNCHVSSNGPVACKVKYFDDMQMKPGVTSVVLFAANLHCLCRACAMEMAMFFNFASSYNLLYL